ncbi:DUF1311 domain-containing protein [Burkholderia glumae]|nr:lysozyme inhibitor LprI family protein [Burkholderia glumae]QHP91150.1 DUF1311 domain-containing protein [Burkholderia glumae]QJW79239.1 DUF1311 domain-containing protein [Burkholderia glumae]RQZ76211.1 DUF1311 domain-containing protein [Burkholderia glumae]UVS85769.1 DUF1311 domain-containing protein [Burkholderia glumae]UVS97236.1 DUF1311 domain-containing protein [Burkholderia glumae]
MPPFTVARAFFISVITNGRHGTPICASRALSEQDVEMAVRFEMLTGLVAMGTRGDMQDAQQAWRQRRAACGASRTCLAAAYRDRIAALEPQDQQLKSRGPFRSGHGAAVPPALSPRPVPAAAARRR